MSGRRALTLISVLALIGIAGIVGMLIARGPVADSLLLLAAALPLGYGWWRYRAMRGSARS